MNERHDPAEKAARLYAALLRLYPKDHRRAFGTQMLQTFKDQYCDRSEQGGRVGIAFWFDVVGDAMKSIAKEQTVALRARRTLPVLMLVIVAILLTAIVIFLAGGISLKLAITIPLIVLLAVAFVVKQFPQTSISSRDAMERVWVRHGVRCGAVFGMLWIIFNLTSNLAAYDSPLYNTARMTAAILFTIGMPVAVGLTGFISGRKSRRMKDGAFAGLLASAISAAIAVVSLIVVMLLFWDTVRTNAFQDPGMIGDWHRSSDQTFGQFLWDDNLGAAFFMTLFSLIFGGLLGTLGGALGASPPRKGGGAGVVIAQSGEGIG